MWFCDQHTIKEMGKRTHGVLVNYSLTQCSGMFGLQSVSLYIAQATSGCVYLITEH